MSTDLMPFTYEGADLRTVVIEGEPWFVAADVSRILGYRMASDMTRRLDEEDRGYALSAYPSGDQEMTIISEPGLYTAALGSQVEGARQFKRWVVATVLPQIRKTGAFVPQTREQIMAMGLQAANELLAEKDTRIAELEPKAEVADRILNAEGDLSVADTAKALTRAGIKVGETRLFNALAQKHWIYRGGDGRWRVQQRVIESGHMTVIPSSHYHPRTGILVLDPPQVRITPKGLQRLLLDHGAEA